MSRALLRDSPEMLHFHPLSPTLSKHFVDLRPYPTKGADKVDDKVEDKVSDKVRTRCFVFTTLLLLLCSCARQPVHLSRFEFNQPEMGLPFRIVLYAPDKQIAESTAAAAFKRIAQLNDCMSDYEADSELSKVSRTAGSGQAAPVSKDLWTVLDRAQKLAQLTDGAFDITVGPDVSVWR